MGSNWWKHALLCYRQKGSGAGTVAISFSFQVGGYGAGHAMCESLTLAVTLWVIRCDAALLNAICFAQLLQQLTFKIPSLVTVNMSGHSIQLQPELWC